MRIPLLDASHPTRSNSIDLVRFGAAFLVVGGHFFLSGVHPVNRYPTFVQEIITFLFQNGTYGVTAFFVVSGFLITQMLVGPLRNLDELDLKKFYVTRAARIIPLLSLIVLIAIPVAFIPQADDPGYYNPFWSGPGGYSPAFGFSIATFTFNWFLILEKPIMQIGLQWALLWSLAVEEQFYLVYPWVVRWSRSRKRLSYLLGLVVLSGPLFRLGVFLWAPGRFDLSYNASFAAFDQLAIGALTFLAFEKIRTGASAQKFPGWLFAILGVIIFFIVYLQTKPVNTAQNILAPTFLASACGLFILGGLCSTLEHRPFLRVLSFPGRLSYGLYLWHCILLMVLWPFVLKAGHWVGPLLFILAVLLWSEASYRFFEIPANRHIRKWFNLPPSRSL